MEPEELSRGCTVRVPGGPCKEGLVVVAPLVSHGRVCWGFQATRGTRAWMG